MKLLFFVLVLSSCARFFHQDNDRYAATIANLEKFCDDKKEAFYQLKSELKELIRPKSVLYFFPMEGKEVDRSRPLLFGKTIDEKKNSDIENVEDESPSIDTLKNVWLTSSFYWQAQEAIPELKKILEELENDKNVEVSNRILKKIDRLKINFLYSNEYGTTYRFRYGKDKNYIIKNFYKQDLMEKNKSFFNFINQFDLKCEDVGVDVNRLLGLGKVPEFNSLKLKGFTGIRLKSLLENEEVNISVKKIIVQMFHHLEQVLRLKLWKAGKEHNFTYKIEDYKERKFQNKKYGISEVWVTDSNFHTHKIFINLENVFIDLKTFEFFIHDIY